MPLSAARKQWEQIASVGFLTIGALLLVLSFVGVRASDWWADQLSYVISAGAGGLFLVGAGTTLMVAADFREESVSIQRVVADLEAPERTPR